jgi:hypothetical protein
MARVAFHSDTEGWVAGRPFVRPLKGPREGARGVEPDGFELQAGCRASSSPTAAASPPMSLISVYS